MTSFPLLTFRTAHSAMLDCRERRIEARVQSGAVGTGVLLDPGFARTKKGIAAGQGASPSGAEVAAYTGAYVSEEIDPVYRIVLDGDKLSLVLQHVAEILRPAVRDVLTGEIGTVRFVRGANGHVAGSVLNADRILISASLKE